MSNRIGLSQNEENKDIVDFNICMMDCEEKKLIRMNRCIATIIVFQIY